MFHLLFQAYGLNMGFIIYSFIIFILNCTVYSYIMSRSVKARGLCPNKTLVVLAHSAMWRRALRTISCNRGDCSQVTAK